MKKDIINVLIEGKTREVSELYYRHRDAFFSYAGKFDIRQADISDIYQEAFIAIRDHALKGKLDSVNCTFKTYLFSICRFMIYDLYNDRKMNIPYSITHANMQDCKDADFEFDDVPTMYERLLKRNFKKLGKKCRDLLTMFYNRGLSIGDIVSVSEYTSENVVRSLKSRCLKQLKELIKNE